MTIKLYNTLTRSKQPLESADNGEIKFYTCGPTVYNYFHIGNARVFVVFDVVRRYLEYRGYKVIFVQNFTDVDDKMIRRAEEMGITVAELAEQYIHAYFEDAQAIGICPADHYPRATSYISQIINHVRSLEEKGVAYHIDGDVYFDVSKFPAYGRLSQQKLEDLTSGARVDINGKKRNPIDFTLWKAAKPGEPSWDSPWGKGRPGWHIECSVMSMAYLGDTLDIHAGGPDLVFPHHENEIAQSEALTGKVFSRQWMHAGYLNINQEKMSKSLGNILTVRELRKKYNPLVLRYFLLSAHYRNPINFAPEMLDQAASALERLQTAYRSLSERKAQALEGMPDKEGIELIEKASIFRKAFEDAMDDDFNTADALSSMFELARASNIYMHRDNVSIEVLEKILHIFEELAGNVLGILPVKEEQQLDFSVEALIKQREQARKDRNFTRADEIRDQLKNMGITLEDTPRGTRWRINGEALRSE